MKHINPGILQFPSQRHGVVDFKAAFDIFRCAESEDEGEILPHRFSDGADHLNGKSHPIFQASAEFIVAKICPGRKELMDEISVGAMDFNGIET